MNQTEELQKQILDAFLSLQGKEALSLEETKKLIRSTNRKMMLAEAGIYLLGLCVHLVGGGVAGSLLGFPFLASGAAVVVLRIVLLFDVRRETKGFRLMLAQKMMMAAADRARVARSNSTSNRDLFPKT